MKNNYIPPLAKQIIMEEESLICDSDPLNLKVYKENADGSEDLANERYSFDDIDDIDSDELW